jgi:autotransporter-associated beta strand protein
VRYTRALPKALVRSAMVCLLLTGGAAKVRANVPGAIVSGTSPAVTLTSNGSTATLSNGIVSIVCNESDAYLTSISYTYNNGSGTTTTQMLNGGTDGGQFYIGTDEYGGFAGSATTYSVVVNPATGDTNHPAGTYGEIDLVSTSSTNGTVDIHFSMLQGSPGFYVTASWMHRSTDGPQVLGETRTNIYAGSIFNWMSVDSGRNKVMAVNPGNTSIPVPGAPVECYLWTSGIYQGLYDDKYKYSADFSDQQYNGTGGPHRVWGWSSVGTGGSNVGMWDVNASQEYYNCGPMKRELMCHIGTTILNMFDGDHYAEGLDSTFANGEVWNKVYGPYFVYCNSVSNTVTDPYQASQALFNDAQAQGAAEASGTPSASGSAVGATAWPYGWFYYNNQYGTYAQASGRGTVTGQILVSDTGNPNVSGSNLYVGVVEQPATSVGAYDFQYWTKPYEFWVQADGNGNFSIPNVIAGANYTLYAFGQGAEGEFMSQNQTGGNPPVTYNLPATPFAVSVTGGSTTNLGTITWTPTRLGATVFEIGYPDRTSRKFRHGDDFWVGDIGASPTSPAPVWTKFLEYPFDFPNGMNYTVGTSRWTTDWDFVQPVVTNTVGDYVDSTGTINFNLAAAPTSSQTASLYIGLASNYGDATIASINGNNLGSTSGVTATPNAEASTGYYSPYNQSDTTIREGNNGLFADERLTFPATLLRAGSNNITISLRQTGEGNSTEGYFADHLMYDYIRMELSGYVPPAPASVTAYAGNNAMLLSWPVTPGATSYNIGRSTTSGSNYSTIATGLLGPVCGSGYNNDTWLDTTASNGTTYYYVVQSVNTTGTSADSAQSTGVAPSAGAPGSPPAAPTLTATAGNGQVSLSWTASAGADFYVIQRSTLANNGGALAGTLASGTEAYNTLGTIILTNTATGTTYVDPTTNNGSTYSYTVTPVNASGTGSASTSINAVPIGVAPTTAPALTATPGAGQVTLNWNAVPGAVGYLVEEGNSASGPFTLVTSITELTYVVTGLANSTNYYFVVLATSSGGTSPNSNVVVATTAPNPPASLTAIPGNTQITLTWPAVTGATSYSVQRSGSSGGPYTAIATAAGASYTNLNLTNGTPYYYVVASANAAGTGSNSEQATATPSASLCVAPANLTATATNGNIVLAWNASAGATSYQLYRSTANGGPYSSFGRTVTTTTVTDTDVLSGITYYYVVAALNSAGAGAYSNQASANTSGIPSLIWTGSASSAWDTATVNWVTSSGTASTYSDGANVIFPDTANTSTVNLAANVSPGSVNFTNSALAYTFNSSSTGILGTVSVVKSGAAPVTLTGAESYSGGTTISDGIYAMGADSSDTAGTLECPGVVGAGGTDASLGSASSPVLVNSGGELRFGGQGGAVYTYVTPNPITIDGGSIYSIDSIQELTGGLTIDSGGASLLTTWSTKNLEINSAFSGPGNVTIDDWQAVGDTAGGVVVVETASNAYNGTITINAPSTGFLGGVLEISNNAALMNATIIDNNTLATGLTFSVTAPQVGALGGVGNIPLTRTGGGGGNKSVTITTGTDGAWTTYSGVLSGGGGLTKTGTGTMILSGSNTYTGATTVNGGVLEILGAIADSSSMTVGSGGVFYLAGGTLHIAGSITNNGIVKLSGSATLSLTGTFTNNGVLDLIDGPQTLPTGFVNNGTVLNANSVQVRQMGMNGSGFSVTIQGYAQHTYQLQSANALVAPITWNNVGAAQTGTGGPLTFTDPSATGTNGFYKVQISP